jgi:hypothetical protein
VVVAEPVDDLRRVEHLGQVADWLQRRIPVLRSRSGV